MLDDGSNIDSKKKSLAWVKDLSGGFLGLGAAIQGAWAGVSSGGKGAIIQIKQAFVSQTDALMKAMEKRDVVAVDPILPPPASPPSSSYPWSDMDFSKIQEELDHAFSPIFKDSEDDPISSNEMISSFQAEAEALLKQIQEWSADLSKELPKVEIESTGEALAKKVQEVIDNLNDLALSMGIDTTGAQKVINSAGFGSQSVIDERVQSIASALAETLADTPSGVLPSNLASQEIVKNIATFLKQAAINPAMRLQMEEAVGALLVSGVTLYAIKALFSTPPTNDFFSDGPPRSYDVQAIDSYYRARPLLVLRRLTSGLRSSSSFLAGLLIDYVTGNGAQNADKRAAQLTSLITDLGPVFIKVGQLISVRPDLVGPAYLRQLQQLQDQVKAFSSKEARNIIAAQLPFGSTMEGTFQDMRAFDKPVAAASLGQVYRAVLKESGKPVAVKVQRPDMLEKVTLDLYTVRLLVKLGAKIPAYRKSCESFEEVLNAWGGRFIQELDYVQEAANSRSFAAAMQANPIVSEAIIVPEVYDALSSRYLLVSEWIEGKKLSSFDKSTEEGRKKLEKMVAVLLNSYLIQLLETGCLHADPHSGNFLVTPDGRLAILDYGLMTEIPEDRRIALIEYIAHLTAKDWEATVLDLVRLGFIPQDIADDRAKLNIVAPVLGSVLEQLSNGGGAKSINVETIGDEVEALADQYPLTIPSYFGLIVRTFSAIEGLGLSLDSRYSIVNQCYPYLARRLLTDDSPRIRAALKSFLYGSDDQLKVERVNEVIAGYRNFSTAFDGLRGAAPTASGAGSLPRTTLLPAFASSSSNARRGGGGLIGLPGLPQRSQYLEFDQPTLETLQILFNKDGNYVQELVVDEMVRMTDAAFKEVTNLIARRVKATPIELRNLFPRPPGLIGPLSNVVLLPLLPLITLLNIFAALADRAENLSQLTEEDRESLKTLRLLLNFLQQQQQQQQRQQGSPAVAVTASPAPAAPFGGFPFPFPPPFPLPGSRSSNLPFPPFPPVPSMSMLQTAVDMSGVLRDVLPEIAPGAAAIGRRFLTQLTSRILSRLADELEGPPSNNQAL